MNLFQFLTLPILVFLLVLEQVRLARGQSTRRSWLVRSLVMVAAGATIAKPGLTQSLAQAIGIGRGADVVLYLFVLLFIVTTLSNYTRNAKLERKLDEIVRHLALDSAQRGRTDEPRREGEDASP